MTNSKTIMLPLDHPIEGELSSVLALDPGGTTGWAILPRDKDSVLCGQIGPGDHHAELWGFLSSLGNHTVVMESFQYRQFQGVAKAKVELTSVEYIGVVKLFGQLYSGFDIVQQTASLAINFVSDNKLKRLDWYKPTAAKPHARDALRHLLYYLIVTKHIREPLVNKWVNQKSFT